MELPRAGWAGGERSAHGVSGRPRRGPATERRSFLPEPAGDLWVGDALHGPLVLAPDGALRKAYLLSRLDGAPRYVPSPNTGRPAPTTWTSGPAHIAASLGLICAGLGIRLLPTGGQDCAAKGVIERGHRTWREEVGDELPDPPLPLAELHRRAPGARAGPADGAGTGRTGPLAGNAMTPSRRHRAVLLTSFGLLLLGAAPTVEAAHGGLHRSTYCHTCPRDGRGRIQRSDAVRRQFKRGTGSPHGRPGMVIDHRVPLACGGLDHPSNLQWLPVEEARAKDRAALRTCASAP